MEDMALTKITENLKNCAIEIKHDNELGRYLVTSRDIQPGEIILNEAPLIKGPAQITGPVCLSCLKNLSEDDHSPCSKCGWPLCNDENCHDPAQHAAECDWTINKRKQKVQIRQFITPHRTYECITTLRCLYQREHNPIVWKKLMELESHTSKRQGTEQYESDKQIIAQFLNRFFKIEPNDFSENDILRICGIIQVNGHEVPLTSPPHVAIYEIASMLEHSCVPNCNKSFSNDGELIIRATRFIPEGEHISICYTDPLWSTLNRLEHLAMTKFFLCQCVRCTDPTELGTYYSALNCFNKKCQGYIVPHLNGKKGKNKVIPDPRWECLTCKTEHSKNEVNKVLNQIAYDFSMTNKHDPSSCEIFLNHYKSNRLLHPNHYFLTNVRLKLAQLYGQTTENDVQSLSDLNLQRKMDLCLQMLEFAALLYPAEWRIHGVLKFELHATVAEDARRKMIKGEIDCDNLKLQLMESKKWLNETVFHLKYEPDNLPEGKITRQAERNLEDLERLLTKMYFQL